MMGGASPSPSRTPAVQRHRPPRGAAGVRIEILTEPESLELLRTEEVGRLGVVADGRPEIFPVNYRLDAADAIVFQTEPGLKLAAALNHHVVFEVDHIADHKAVWSVIVHGVAQHTALESLRFAGPLPSSWLPARSNTMRITVSSVSGRRFNRLPKRRA